MEPVDNKIYKYKVESEHGLWEPTILTVHKGVIVGSTVKQGYEIGSNWQSMRKHFEQGEGENKYIITEINDSNNS